MSRRDIVAIGGSTGGVPAMIDVVAALPRDFPAAVLAVLHIGANESQMPALLSSRGALRAIHPQDGQVPEPGVVHVAPPDRHMIVEGGRLRLVHGPKEHHTRPAIDPLFRSAAADQRERVIGVVLSGGMDDGTAGLQAIKACGGLAVVQHPATAIDPSMPMSALTYAPVDYVRPLGQLAPLLVELAGQPVGATPSIPDRLLHELANFQGTRQPMEHLDAIGRPSVFTCPECDGVLWELADTQPPRFRCHTGHAFSLRSLDADQRGSTEDAIWAAMRALQERAQLLRRLADSAAPGEAEAIHARWASEADAAAEHAKRLKAIIEDTPRE
jgi:two-component system chemotaxis response regulator CheB